MMGKIHTVSDPKYDIKLPEPYRISQEAPFNAELSAAEQSAPLFIIQ
jgi:hypothetical protein